MLGVVLEWGGTVLDVQPIQAALAAMTVVQKESGEQTQDATYQLVGGRTGSF